MISMKLALAGRCYMRLSLVVRKRGLIMPRLKQAGREAKNPYADQIFNMLFGDRDPVEEPGTATGTPGNWWTVFNIVPDAFKHTLKVLNFIDLISVC